MGIIKTLLGAVILLAIIIFGYWLYATYTLAAADDEIWIKINSQLPSQLREWSCKTVNGRMPLAQAPKGCDAFWKNEEIRPDASRPIISIEKPAPFGQPSQSGN